MKKYSWIWLHLLILPCFFCVSCGNKLPKAYAGPDQAGIGVSEIVQLDGSDSYDPDNDPLTYFWKVEGPDGSGATLVDPTVINPTFTADVRGEYVATLTVSDGIGSDSDTVIITTENQVPVADAGIDQVGTGVGTLVQLDGSDSSDPDGDSITYLWSLEGPAGSTATLSDPGIVDPSFIPDVKGEYILTLTVSDWLDSATDTVTITIGNQAPVADAGADQEGIAIGTLVQLDGSASYDPDDDPITYSWALVTPDGSTAVLSDPGVADPTFTPDLVGEYALTLTVSDGIDSGLDTMLVTVTVLNQAPVADAGADQIDIIIGALVQLDGSGSSDPDSDPITFLWAIECPAGSAAALSDPAVVDPSFTPDVKGEYILTLTVSDGMHSATDTMTVTVINQAPVADAGPDQTYVTIGELVQLDGTGSDDPDGDTITYSWTLEVPAGSASSLSDSTIADPTFTPDIEGVFVAHLTVSDGTEESTDSVYIGNDEGIFFYEDFENVTDTWSVDNGVWEIGVPTAGPSECPSPTKCAGTVLDGNYPQMTDSRLVSPTIKLPIISGEQEIHLSFWHWFSIEGHDSGRIQIREKISPDEWTDWTTRETYYYDSGIWTIPRVDLSVFAGKDIQIGFLLDQHTSAGGVGPGWFVDDVSLSIERSHAVTVDQTYTFDFEADMDDWSAWNGMWEVGVPTTGPAGCHSGTKCAATVLDGDYPQWIDSRLVSPSIVLSSISSDQEINLWFWHWFSFDKYDIGRVQVREEIVAGEWTDWTTLKVYYYDSGAWTKSKVDLSIFTEKKIQIGFLLDQHTSYIGVAPGWFVDDVLVSIE